MKRRLGIKNSYEKTTGETENEKKYLHSKCNASTAYIVIYTSCFYGAPDQLKLLSIVIPNKVGSLVVGKSNYSEVIKLLGEPELTESKSELGTEFLELKYPLKGIEISINKNKQMRTTRIEVYSPFSGTSTEGIRLGIPIAESKNLISSRFGKPSNESDGYVDWDINKSIFALKHENGLVIAVKMLGD